MAAQRATFKENQCPYARPVMQIEILDIEHGSPSRFTSGSISRFSVQRSTTKTIHYQS
jgi:hypothetical protein